MLASISLAVERDGGVKKCIHAFCPPRPTTHTLTHPSIPIPPTLLSHYLHSGEVADKRGQPPSGSTSASKLTLTHSDGCLIVRDTGRALSLSNLKQIASPWGGDYWTSRDDKAETVQPSGGWRTEGGKLVGSVCEYTFFYVFLLYMPEPQEDYVWVHVFQMRARVGDNQERVCKTKPLIARSVVLFVHFLFPFVTFTPPFLSSSPLLLYPASTSPSVSLLTQHFLSFSLLSPCCIYAQ